MLGAQINSAQDLSQLKVNSQALGADKPKGYAFVEYEHKNDMKSAYKQADGRKLEGRRVTVDVERGRTVPGW